ncbi:restriction endonuclease subunit S [Bradyrhizobium sp. HKCCYLRH3099]|uniref:restriction endonuclease subunit S n=1 Tax=unclassified Bradyrhizobium TaxID=2631580 RepID=UPI003EBBA4A1
MTTVDANNRESQWELPESWSWIPLGEIVDIHDHRRRPIRAQDRQTRIQGRSSAELFPYYGATGQVGLIDGFLFNFPAILLGEDGAPFLDRQRAKAYAVEGKYWVNNHAHILTPRGSVLARWLLHSLNFVDYEPHVGGTTRLKLTKADLEQIPIPLAPLAEQRRIVARIDELFAEIAAGEAALADARKGLETFRRALLKAAVTGELTRDWRTTYSPRVTGHEIIQQLKKAESAKSRGTSPNDIRANLMPFQLPASWAWTTVENVGLVQLGRQRAPQHHTGDYMRPYMRVANVFEDRIDVTDVKEMNFTPDEFETFRLHDGDILLNEGQTPDLLGRAAIWREQIDGCCFQNTLIRFRAKEGIAPEWALMVFRAYLHMKRFKRESQITTNIAHLSAGRFSKIEFPVPPPEEATEILGRVSNALSAAADTLSSLDAEAADAARLKQAILKSAFEGRLVPQDPADEPASALLARTAAERPAQPVKRGRGKRSAGKTA